MREDMGVPASPSGHSAEPEPISVVSAVPASVPNAMSAVERVAHGLFLAEHPNADWHGGGARGIWWNRAYAALEAMREPTDAMLAGACEKHLPGRPMHDTTPPYPDERYRTEKECPRIVSRRRIWQRMVDAALAWPTSADVASAIEARRAATVKQGAVADESAVGEAETPNHPTESP